ncbi:MAG TPA: serine/threonine protein kinase, partial [Amnibacterium sp.]|nr:serine/threonine protein kinase [Amnibacterium sp.]
MSGARVKLGDLIAGRYRLDAVAGRGGLGVVHRATDTATGRPMQVTVLYARIRAVLDPERLDGARDVLRAVAHPALAVPLDLVSDPPAIVTAPVGGRSLSGLLAEGPLDEPAVAAIGARLGAGLAALHEHGPVHRWIRPSAIAVDEDGRPTLLDVGVTELLK